MNDNGEEIDSKNKTTFSDYENSVKLYGTYDKEKEKAIITERCDLNLRQFALKKGSPFTPQEIKENFLDEQSVANSYIIDCII